VETADIVVANSMNTRQLSGANGRTSRSPNTRCRAQMDRDFHRRPLYGAFVLRGILYVVHCFQIDARFGLEPPHEWKQAEAGTEAIALGWDRGLRIGLEVDLGK